MSGVGWQPPHKGPNGQDYRPVQYNADGTQRGRVPSKEEQEKRKAKLVTDLKRYEARSERTKRGSSRVPPESKTSPKYMARPMFLT